MLLACLDVPSNYESGPALESANVILIRENGDSSTVMQVPAKESFELAVTVVPSELAEELHFAWFANNSEISKKQSYTYKTEKEIPDSICIFDNAGNSIGKSIHIVQNTPPVFEKLISPSNGDTLESYARAPILFKWSAYDADKDTLTYLIEVDGISYAAGRSSSIYQGGFSFGPHTLRIIVRDNFYNADTSSTIKFYIQEKEEP